MNLVDYVERDPDDEAWKELFITLTGGTEEGLPGSRSKVNLTVETIDGSERRSSYGGRKGSWVDAIFDRRPSATPGGPRLSLSPSFTKKDVPLLEPKDRAITIETLEEFVCGKKSVELEIEYGIHRTALQRIVQKLKKHDENGNSNGKIEYEEWISFYHDNFKDAKSVMPVLEWFVYQPTYSCLPPPILILFFSVLQIICYVYHSYYISNLVQDPSLSWQSAACSYLIYHPNKRYQVWRFLTYQFVHVNLEHIVFNILMQLIVGVPLEMSQPGMCGTLRVVLVYFSGVILGTLVGSLTSPGKFMAGASAGVYALIAAHLATLVLNWKEDGDVFKGRKKNHKRVSQSLNPLIRLTKLIFVLTFTTFDIGYAMYNHYSGVMTNTGYMGHFSGALAGLLVGLVALENRKVEEWEVKLKMGSVITYLIILFSAILWHLIGTDTGYFPPSSYEPCRYIINSTFIINSTVDHSHF